LRGEKQCSEAVAFKGLAGRPPSYGRRSKRRESGREDPGRYDTGQ